jgi:hypothetical protein
VATAGKVTESPTSGTAGESEPARLPAEYEKQRKEIDGRARAVGGKKQSPDRSDKQTCSFHCCRRLFHELADRLPKSAADCGLFDVDAE